MSHDEAMMEDDLDPDTSVTQQLQDRVTVLEERMGRMSQQISALERAALQQNASSFPNPLSSFAGWVASFFQAPVPASRPVFPAQPAITDPIAHERALREEQETIQKKLAARQRGDISALKVGDIVERRTNESLNFTPSFQRTPVIQPNSPQILCGDYWWPCTVLEASEQGVMLHYLGYDDAWDHFLSIDDFEDKLRPLMLAQDGHMNRSNLPPRTRVEVRLLQRTNIPDADADLAYCWVEGEVVRVEKTDDIAVIRFTEEARAGGIQEVRVSLSALRSIS